MAITVNSVLELPSSKKILILIGILCVIAGIYFYLFFIPMQDDMRVLKTELDKLMKELNEGRMITRELEKFKGQVEKLNAELTSALTQLPNEKEIPEILKSISRLGQGVESGVLPSSNPNLKSRSNFMQESLSIWWW